MRVCATMIYKQFHVSRFRGIADITVSLTKGDLVLFVGLNESGKTTILRSIEAFDHRNDPEDGDRLAAFHKSVRNKSDEYANEPATISADIELPRRLRLGEFRRALRPRPTAEQSSLLEDFLKVLNRVGKVTVTRVFPFKGGEAQMPFYRFESDHGLTVDQEFASQVAARLVELCPFILYFEDFTDRIPERIFVVKSNDAFNPDWYDILDGLFYNTRDNYSIASFKRLYGRAEKRLDDAHTVMRRVNATLNDVFTRKWEKLSGVSDIDETLLLDRFHGRSPYFEFKITDTDGTTFSVDERSKGALWYLSFLMKTEFRRKKMRADSGKPIFLIDEPASNLHSTAQTNMLDDFRKLVEDTTVIYTTHSQYLVSLENIKNTHVIRRQQGVVAATLWSDYIREEAPLVTHYQPLANLLQLVPSSLVVPWEKVVITEGYSDMHVLTVMHRALKQDDPPFVIYPGTNAFNLGTLISFNIGWRADFRVLLDSDAAGLEAQAGYIEEYGLDDTLVLVLPVANKKIEGYFTENEKKKLYRLAFQQPHSSKVKKKEFAATMALLSSDRAVSLDLTQVLGDATVRRFKELFAKIGLS